MFSNTPSAPSSPKPLPPLNREDKLPLPPPSPLGESFGLPPPPPPKITQNPSPVPPLSFDEASLTPRSNYEEHSLSPTSPSPSDPRSFLSAPSISVPPSPSPDGKAKRPNPLIDLIQTEKIYVDMLAGIIRKVASAWSRQNLPPPELDSMFRGVEGVYKANRALLAKLNEIGTTPSSPRPLGDLLMRWIDDLDSPYTNYCSRFLGGFDAWDPVQSNSRLLTVLATFSASNPPPLPPSSAPHPAEPPLWTLDSLFSLPRSRIRYYQKLYGKLLKNKTPGRSSDKMLTEAVEKLDRLMTILDERAGLQPGNSTSMLTEAVDEVVIDTRAQGLEPRESEETVRPSDEQHIRGSIASSAESSRSSGMRVSQDTAATSLGRSSTGTLSAPLSDLEWRLATNRCLDLFTLKPKAVQLVINPPSLPYTRTLRFSMDVDIQFTPKFTGVEIVHRHAHIYLLTDLFLICEKLPPEERAQSGPDSPDMSLCYPPLAGKHLRVAPLEGAAVLVTILRKENMIVHAESENARDLMLREFQACIDLAMSLPPPSKGPVPPMPSLNGLPRSPSAPLPLDRQMSPLSTQNLPGPSASRSANVSPRTSSPIGGEISMRRTDPHRQGSTSTEARTSQSSPPDVSPSMARMALSSEAQMQSIAPRLPSIHDPASADGQPVLRTSSTAEALSGPPSYSPGQNIPFISAPDFPQRQGPDQNGPSSFAPGQIIPPPRGESAISPPPNSLNGVGLPPRPAWQADGPPSFTPGQIIPPPRGESAKSPPNGTKALLTQHPRQTGIGTLSQGPGGVPPPGSMSFQQLRNHGPQPLSQERLYQGGHPAPFAGPSGRSPSDPSYQGGLRKSPSARSLGSQYEQPYMQQPRSAPPVPALPGGHPNMNQFAPGGRAGSFVSLQAPQPRTMLPSAAFGPRAVSSAPSSAVSSYVETSPPNSPIEEQTPSGPVTSSVCATMKCKVFLQQQHAQWKSLGGANLTLFEQHPTNIKQLVVKADNKEKTMLISTIVLTDGVERVGKTGVAIELSDKGARTGIVYMIQLRNEKSAGGLFDSLLAGSDRAAGRN